LSDLPTGWSSAAVTDLARFVRGVTYTKSDARETLAIGLIGIIRANNIGDFRLDLSDLVYVPERFVSPEQKLQIGDVVIATSSGSVRIVGKGAPVLTAMPLSFGAFCGVLRPIGEMEPRYFGRYFQSDAYRLAASAAARGVNINNLKRSHFDSFQIAFPGRQAQLRIAEKLDSVLSRVETCRARLDRVPQILKKFREAVLEAAVSGRLTEEWRGSPELTGWATKTAAEVCTVVQSGGTPKAGFTESSGVPFLKVYNIVDQHVAFEYRPQYVPSTTHEKELRKSRTLPGDVLMNIVGPPLGKVAVVPGTYAEWNINQAITLFRPGPEVSTQWIYAVLCSGRNVAEVIHQTRGSVGQVNISLSQCRDFRIPVPPHPEQTEIMRRLGELFALADSLQRRYQDSVTRIEKLTPSVLAKAFRGELVPRDPNDEPAGEMLERMRAVHASESAPTMKIRAVRSKGS
jgi:type I restriction enzyme S subunit